VQVASLIFFGHLHRAGFGSRSLCARVRKDRRRQGQDLEIHSPEAHELCKKGTIKLRTRQSLLLGLLFQEARKETSNSSHHRISSTLLLQINRIATSASVDRTWCRKPLLCPYWWPCSSKVAMPFSPNDTRHLRRTRSSLHPGAFAPRQKRPTLPIIIK